MKIFSVYVYCSVHLKLIRFVIMPVNAKILTEEDLDILNQKIKDLEGKIFELMNRKQNEEPQKEFLSVKEFINLIGVSRSTFENMKNESDPNKFKIDFIRRGTRVFVPRREVDRYFKEN
ncbi:MAG: helix-turn-helix transcriptional regulator [Bacteroidota bacterium]|uniref:helix-turn-helix transcriptional regulator n=1 Tax=Algoriphagus faecimaris TaxID=686796 RepID=UPI001114300B|nr:helix-turn-helix domain-containing protein [Algoriphagus faecimaris]